MGIGRRQDFGVRFALDVGSEIGQRAAKIVLGDARCEQVVLLNPGWRPDDARVTLSEELTGCDVVISDGTTSLYSLIRKVSAAGVPLVVWDETPDSDFPPSVVPIVIGANVGRTLSEALLTHPSSQPQDTDTVKVAWTEPGKPLGRGMLFWRGTAIAFPEPIGMAWAWKRSLGRFVAFRQDEWAGATTMVEGPSGQRIVGVADHGAHLEALTLVAVAFAAADGAFEPGIQHATNAAAQVLAEARTLELDVAVWRSRS